MTNSEWSFFLCLIMSFFEVTNIFSNITWIVPLLVFMAIIFKMKNKRDKLRFRVLLILSVICVALFGFVIFYSYSSHESPPDHLPVNLDVPVSPASLTEERNFYGIMFDAGSTGTRIHVFKFLHKSPGKPFQFVSEYFRQMQPGLSSYATDPDKCTVDIKVMLEKAKELIPVKQHAQTPLELKATAGLRLLPGTQSEVLLDKVRQLFKSMPFKVYDDSVSIMDGTKEGIFSWFTVNFLTGTLGDKNRMTAVMDLGGGSTQITFIPSEKKTLSEAPKNHLISMNILDKNYDLYTYSYLERGLMAARFTALGGTKDSPKTIEVTSPCFIKSQSTKWNYGAHDLTISGEDVIGSRFEACSKKTVKVIKEHEKIFQPLEVNTRESFLAISYYYDRALETELIKGAEGGFIKIKQLFTAAKHVCENPKTKSPFLCLDLSYICSLLSDGFGFKETSNLQVRKQIDNNEISWALGAMYSTFNKHKELMHL